MQQFYLKNGIAMAMAVATEAEGLSFFLSNSMGMLTAAFNAGLSVAALSQMTGPIISTLNGLERWVGNITLSDLIGPQLADALFTQACRVGYSPLVQAFAKKFERGFFWNPEFNRVEAELQRGMEGRPASTQTHHQTFGGLSLLVLNGHFEAVREAVENSQAPHLSWSQLGAHDYSIAKAAIHEGRGSVLLYLLEHGYFEAYEKGLIDFGKVDFYFKLAAHFLSQSLKIPPQEQESGLQFLRALLPKIKDLNLLLRGKSLLTFVISESPLEKQIDTKYLNLLLEAGVDINRAGKSGITALMAAASRGDASLVKFLMEHGADPHLKDHHGHTAVEHIHRPEKREAVLAALTPPLGSTWLRAFKIISLLEKLILLIPLYMLARQKMIHWNCTTDHCIHAVKASTVEPPPPPAKIPAVSSAVSSAAFSIVSSPALPITITPPRQDLLTAQRNADQEFLEAHMRDIRQSYEDLGRALKKRYGMKMPPERERLETDKEYELARDLMKQEVTALPAFLTGKSKTVRDELPRVLAFLRAEVERLRMLAPVIEIKAKKTSPRSPEKTLPPLLLETSSGAEESKAAPFSPEQARAPASPRFGMLYTGVFYVSPEADLRRLEQTGLRERGVQEFYERKYALLKVDLAERGKDGEARARRTQASHIGFYDSYEGNQSETAKAETRRALDAFSTPAEAASFESVSFERPSLHHRALVQQRIQELQNHLDLALSHDAKVMICADLAQAARIRFRCFDEASFPRETTDALTAIRNQVFHETPTAVAVGGDVYHFSDVSSEQLEACLTLLKPSPAQGALHDNE